MIRKVSFFFAFAVSLTTTTAYSQANNSATEVNRLLAMQKEILEADTILMNKELDLIQKHGKRGVDKKELLMSKVKLLLINKKIFDLNISKDMNQSIWQNYEAIKQFLVSQGQWDQALAAMSGDPFAPATGKTSTPAEKNILYGFDLSLGKDEFKKTYKSQVMACKPDRYSNKEVGADYELDIEICELKSGKVHFYNNQIFMFNISPGNKNVKMRLAREKLEEKLGRTAKLRTYGDGFFNISCAYQAPFLSGTAVLLSENIISQIVQKHERGGDYSCDASMVLDANLETISYRNTAQEDKMHHQLINLRDKKERKDADKDFDL